VRTCAPSGRAPRGAAGYQSLRFAGMRRSSFGSRIYAFRHGSRGPAAARAPRRRQPAGRPAPASAVLRTVRCVVVLGWRRLDDYAPQPQRASASAFFGRTSMMPAAGKSARPAWRPEHVFKAPRTLPPRPASSRSLLPRSAQAVGWLGRRSGLVRRGPTCAPPSLPGRFRLLGVWVCADGHPTDDELAGPWVGDRQPASPSPSLRPPPPLPDRTFPS
jgi:hypothetical protein